MLTNRSKKAKKRRIFSRNLLNKKKNTKSIKGKNFLIKNNRVYSAFLLKRRKIVKNPIFEKKRNYLLKIQIEKIKEELNQKKTENLKLNTKIQSSEQEMKKMNELKKKIKDFLKSNKDDKKKVKNEMEIFFLKKDILNLNKKIQVILNKTGKIKNDSIKDIKNYYEIRDILKKKLLSIYVTKQIKLTKKKEIKKKIDKLEINNFQKQKKIQGYIIEKLNKNNINALQSLYSIKSKIVETEEENKNLEIQNLKSKKSICKNKKNIQKVMKYIQNELKRYNIDSCDFCDEKIQKNLLRNSKENFKKLFEDLELKIKNMKKNVNEKEGQIDFILYKIKEFSRKNLKIQYLNKKNQNNTITIEEEKTDLIENFEKIKKDLQFYFKMKKKPKKKEKKKDDTIFKYFRTVKTEDIKITCQELRFRLMKKKISLPKVFKIFENFTTEKNNLKIINLKAINDNLKKTPFELDEKNSLLLARYFTEDNSVNKIAYKEDRYLEFKIFKSILKSLIGDIKIYNKKFIKTEFLRIQKILLKKKTNIIESFTRLMKIRGDFVSIENLKFNFMTNDLIFNSESFEIILMKLYEEDGNLARLNYKKLFE